ncbi:MAG: T9SS type A sorting domain-containing protein [Bacteroidia bacterium]
MAWFNLELYGINCAPQYTLSNDITINITDISTFTTDISDEVSPNTIDIKRKVIVPDGKTLTIKGIHGSKLNVNFTVFAGIIVKPGGLLIIEYCNLGGSGVCYQIPTNTDFSTWDGIMVEGDPNEEHYSWFDLNNGWDPYAEPFVPGGTYTLNSAGTGYAHGRAQIRFSSFSGIWTEGGTNESDEPSEYLKENHYGNYAIRSTEGGILNIIDCNFSNVKTAILIDNYTQYPTGDPESSLMNAFQVVDCQFDVSSSQRASGPINDKYRYCIELYEVQKVTIEGCVFNSNGSETWNTSMGTAIYMVNSSLLMHKSGNFRRAQDFSSGETALGCPEYGKEMDWSGKDTNHVWHTDSLLRCQFNNFNRAIDAVGNEDLITDPLHTLALDDVEFYNTYFTVRCKWMVGVTISRSDFSFDESAASFSILGAGGPDEHSSDAIDKLDQNDKVDITLNTCKNSLITECTFSSNYNGLGSQSGKNIYIQLYDLLNGKFSEKNYELIYKNTFNPINHGADIGVWLARNTSNLKMAYVLFNCNTFEHLNCAIFIGKKRTKLCNQFHYTDIGSGMDASAQNTFSSNDCDFDAYQDYEGGIATYYRLTSETSPNDCEAGGTGMAVVSDVETNDTDEPDCSSLTCTKFPMKLSVNIKHPSYASIFPNPNNGTFTLQFANPIQDANVSIVDLTGKVVYKKQIDDEVKSLLLNPNLSSGYYNIVVTTSNQSFIQKLVIE